MVYRAWRAREYDNLINAFVLMGPLGFREERSLESTGEEWKMKKLYRSTDNKKIAGIFGGLGEIFDIDPTLLRLVFAFIGLVTAILPIVIAYLIGWIIIPKGKQSSEAAK